MTQRTLYPLWLWVVWALVIPLALTALGGVLVAVTDVGDLPLDNAHLWWLGAAVPGAGLFVLYGVVRRRRAITRFTSAELAPLLAARLSPGRQAFRAGLLVLALVSIVAAILGPRWGIYLEKQKVRGVDVVVAVDVSRSMLARDLEPNRLARAKEVIRQELTEREVFQRAHRLGLIAFAGTTSLRLPLTTDHLAFRSKLEALDIGSAPRGGTAIGRTIRRATELFARSPEDATKVLLLFTDGEDHEGDPIAEAVTAYEEHGVRVFPIGVGDPSRTVGAQVPASADGKPLLYEGEIVFSKLDISGLQKIADAGHGRYAPLMNLHSLVDAISDLRSAELSTEQRQRHRPQYQWFVALALFLLGLETLIAPRSRAPVALPKRTWTTETTE